MGKIRNLCIQSFILTFKAFRKKLCRHRHLKLLHTDETRGITGIFSGFVHDKSYFMKENYIF